MPLKGGDAYDFVRFLFRLSYNFANYSSNKGIRKTAI